MQDYASDFLVSDQVSRNAFLTDLYGLQKPFTQTLQLRTTWFGRQDCFCIYETQNTLNFMKDTDLSRLPDQRISDLPPSLRLLPSLPLSLPPSLSPRVSASGRPGCCP